MQGIIFGSQVQIAALVAAQAALAGDHLREAGQMPAHGISVLRAAHAGDIIESQVQMKIPGTRPC